MNTMTPKLGSELPVVLPTGKTITGTLVWYYTICKREAWLMGHSVLPDETNESLDKGRVIHESAFRRMKKEIELEGMKIDFVDSKSGDVCEVKSTSRAFHAAKLQLAYYLYRLNLMGISRNGFVVVPKEKKRIPVVLDEELMSELSAALKGLTETCMLPAPPQPQKNPYCKGCAYNAFCWGLT